MTATAIQTGVTPEAFASLYPRLYHMAHEDAWPQIQRHGLLSTRSILERWEVEASLRTRIETRIRKSNAELWHPLHGKAVIRDQKPMQESRLRSVLVDCTTEEWCRLLNRKVFFWPSRERLQTHMSARENRGKRHLVLTLDSYRFAAAYEGEITLCAINSGSTLRFPQQRGGGSFLKMSAYPFEARRRRGASKAVAEVAVDADIPDVLDFVVSADYMNSVGEVRRVARE